MKGIKKSGLPSPNHQKAPSAVFKIVLSLLIFVSLMSIGSLKVGYHLDDMFTMGLANYDFGDRYIYDSNDLGPEIKDGAVYNGQQLWREYTTVSEDGRFDYKNVLKNQSVDVHPPLFYILIHTVSSFFPGTYSKSFPLFVNSLLAIIVFWEVVWLFCHFINNKRLSLLFSLLFVFTMGFVNSVVFFRMYVLLAVWTNALVILFCKYKPETPGSLKYYASLTLILIGGMMTQYYFIIFAFFACIVYAIRTALKHNYKKILFSCLSALLSLGIFTLIFPAIWAQIFTSYRGEAAFDSLSASGFWSALWKYIDFINLRVFGNLFIILFFCSVILFIEKSKSFGSEKAKAAVSEYIQLLIPALCYIVVVVRVAPFIIDRYVMNTMGLLYSAVFIFLIYTARLYSKQAVLGIIAAAFIVLFCSYKNGVPYLYTSEKNNIAKIEKLGDDVPCLFLYGDSTARILPNYIEMSNLENIVFLGNDSLELLDETDYKSYDRLLVFVIKKAVADADNIADEIKNKNEGLTTCEELFTSSYATAYYLE